MNQPQRWDPSMGTPKPLPMPELPIPPTAPVLKTTNHLLHFVLCLFSFGMWVPVWPFVAIINNATNKSKQDKFARESAVYEQRRTDYEHHRAMMRRH